MKYHNRLRHRWPIERYSDTTYDFGKVGYDFGAPASHVLV